MIARPLVVQQGAADPKTNLERLLALHDGNIRRQARRGGAYAPTCPQSI